MLKLIKQFSIIASTCSLFGCGMYNVGGYPPPYQPQANQGTQLYPEGYENTVSYTRSYSTQEQPVSVPDSYHVGTSRQPVKHQSMDHQWASSQNSTSYTIEVADSDKPAAVANTLLKVPKNERMAEIKVQQGDKTSYKGVYGTYPTKEAAEQARQALPADVQSAAQVKSWGSIQGMTRD